MKNITYEEYLDAISIIGKWYVNNIPTYLTSLQEEDLKEYIYYNDLFENVKIADSRATS